MGGPSSRKLKAEAPFTTSGGRAARLKPSAVTTLVGYLPKDASGRVVTNGFLALDEGHGGESIGFRWFQDPLMALNGSSWW